MKTKNLVQLLGALCICLCFASCKPSEPSGGGEKPANENYGTMGELQISPEDLRSDQFIQISSEYSRGKKTESTVYSYSCTQNGKVVKEESNKELDWASNVKINLQLEAGSYDISVTVTETIEGEKPRTMSKSASFTVRYVDFDGSAWGESMEATENYFKAESLPFTKEGNTLFVEKTKSKSHTTTRTYQYTNNALVSIKEEVLFNTALQTKEKVTKNVFNVTNNYDYHANPAFKPFSFTSEVAPDAHLTPEAQSILDKYNNGQVVDDLLHTYDKNGDLGQAVIDEQVVLKAHSVRDNTVANLTTEVRTSGDTKIVVDIITFQKK